MVQIERIRQLAEEVLTFQQPAGKPVRWLWDRACRIARYGEAICKLPEINKMQDGLDLFCLQAATYFSDSGYILYSQLKEVSVTDASLTLRGRELRDFSVQVVQEHCQRRSYITKLDRICRILTESENRFTRLPEARILSDARCLDDIGALGILQDVRRCVLAGKGISSLLEGWKRKIEYRYWDARLKEGFHFPSVRQIAQRRFAAMEQCIRQLESEHLAEDLTNISLESAPSVL